MPPRTHKYGPNARPFHSEEPIQVNLGRRVSLTQQGRGKCKTSRRSHNYRIKWRKATFSAPLMWKRQANSVSLANATHRKIRKISDGTGTQVKVQMDNKCKVLINLRRLYKGRKSPWRRDRNLINRKERGRKSKAIVFDQNQRCTHTVPRTKYPVDIKEIFLRSNCCMACN